jgi:SAM-dependent methyltransferase
MMANFFGRGEKSAGGKATVRAPRPSSGWRDLLAHVQESEGLRVLDFGATSSNNINYLTGLGHSVYMANVVEEAARPEWMKPTGAEGNAEFDVAGFVEANLGFSGRDFDVVLLWDTADYLPEELVPALFARMHEVLRPEGRLLAFFHGKATGPETLFSRYQLTETSELQVLGAGDFPVRAVYQPRQIEKFLEDYASTRFFLGKDSIREVLAVR